MAYKSWIYEYYDSIYIENRVDIDCFKLFYLIKYKVFYNFINDNVDINDVLTSNCIDDLQELILNCNFKQRLQQCKIKTVTKNEASSYFEMYDWLEVRKLTSLIFSVYLNSIFSLIIIILNILTLKIIKSKSVLKEKNPMYDFLFLNTLMSMIYIIIVLFKIIGICVNNNDYYCSPLNETKFNIYYKTIVILFCGETLKTASNFKTRFKRRLDEDSKIDRAFAIN